MKNISKILLISFLFSCSKNENLEGKRLYETKCLNCHQENGKGVGSLIPPIDPTYIKENRSKLACIITNGIDNTLIVNNISYNKPMPAIEKLKEADLVNILNYIGQNFGNNLPIFTIKEVQKDLKNCK